LFLRKQAKRKRQISLNEFLLLPGKAPIYSVDLNFIGINIDKMISLLEPKNVWQQRKVTEEVQE